MTERSMLLLLAVLLGLAAVGLTRVATQLRRRGRSRTTELAGALLLVVAGAFALLREAVEHRTVILSATLVVAVGLVWMVEALNNRLIDSLGHISRCSFCGKSQREVRKLVEATEASICDECIEICRNTIGVET